MKRDENLCVAMS